jgi:hypothetical protein
MPHQWCHRRDNPAAAEWFDQLIRAIRESDQREIFKGRRRPYLYPGDGRKYWEFGRLVNRMLVADLMVLPPEHRVFRSLADWRAGINPIFG